MGSIDIRPAARPWAADSIDGRVRIGHIDAERRGVPDGDIYITERGAPKPFGLLFGRSDKREMVSVRQTQQNIGNAIHLINAVNNHEAIVDALQAVLHEDWRCGHALSEDVTGPAQAVFQRELRHMNKAFFSNPV